MLLHKIKMVLIHLGFRGSKRSEDLKSGRKSNARIIFSRYDSDSNIFYGTVPYNGT